MPHKQKAPMEEKVNLARACIEGKMSRRDASRKADVNPSTIGKWISRYQSEGSAAFLPYERNRVYSSNLKRQAVQDYLTGKGSLQAICCKYKMILSRMVDTFFARNFQAACLRVA